MISTLNAVAAIVMAAEIDLSPGSQSDAVAVLGVVSLAVAVDVVLTASRGLGHVKAVAGRTATGTYNQETTSVAKSKAEGFTVACVLANASDSAVLVGSRIEAAERLDRKVIWIRSIHVGRGGGGFGGFGGGFGGGCLRESLNAGSASKGSTLDAVAAPSAITSIAAKVNSVAWLQLDAVAVFIPISPSVAKHKMLSRSRCLVNIHAIACRATLLADNEESTCVTTGELDSFSVTSVLARASDSAIRVGGRSEATSGEVDSASLDSGEED